MPFGHRCPEGNEYEDTNNMMGPEHNELLAEQVGSLSNTRRNQLDFIFSEM